ncbi:sensor histidine kinase [Actinomycetospora flava]|uniref:histidine kinase n=1 Tax=Actinomycetospora flava TaxID=3129232 RepID=A0ABU8LZ28_9PSEU
MTFPELRPVDALVVGVLLVMVALSALAVGAWNPGVGGGRVVAVVAAGAVQTVPVLWRRVRPVGALVVFAVSVPVGWALVEAVPTYTWAVLVFGVVRRARPLPGAVAVVGTTLAAPLLAGLAVHPREPLTALGVGASLEITLVPFVLGAGALALVARVRAARVDARRRQTEHERLADALGAQRDRLAGDLRELVAVRVERVVTRTRSLADAPDPAPVLTAIAAEARAALAGMRRALSVLRGPVGESDASGEAGPVPAPAREAPSPWAPSRGGLALAVAVAGLAGVLGLLADYAAPHLRPGSPVADTVALFDLDPTRPLGLLPLLVQAATLGWWRRAPLPALVVATAASAVASAMGTTHLVTEASWSVLVFGAGLGAGVVASGLTVLACTAAVAMTTLTLGLPAALASSRASVALSYVIVPAIWGLGVLQRRAARAAAGRADARAAENAARAVTAQRLGLARELHDVLAHELSALVVTVHAARVAPDPATLATITEAGERIATALPTLLDGLGPGVPSGEEAEHLELDAATVAALVAPVREAGLPVTVDVVGAAPADRPETDVIAARIVTEALTNTLRHAGPAPTRVTVRHEPEAVAVEVVDEGVRAGHAVSREGSGLGIVGMRERAALVGGTVEAGPSGGGWRVAARLPRQEAGVLVEASS